MICASLPQEPVLEMLLLQLIDRAVAVTNDDSGETIFSDGDKLLQLAGMLCQKVGISLSFLLSTLTRLVRSSQASLNSSFYSVNAA